MILGVCRASIRECQIRRRATVLSFREGVKKRRHCEISAPLNSSSILSSGIRGYLAAGVLCFDTSLRQSPEHLACFVRVMHDRECRRRCAIPIFWPRLSTFGCKTEAPSVSVLLITVPPLARAALKAWVCKSRKWSGWLADTVEPNQVPVDSTFSLLTPPLRIRCVQGWTALITLCTNNAPHLRG